MRPRQQKSKPEPSVGVLQNNENRRRPFSSMERPYWPCFENGLIPERNTTAGRPATRPPLVATFNEAAALILNVVCTGGKYREVTAILESRYGDYHLAKTSHAHLRRKAQHDGNLFTNLLLSSHLAHHGCFDLTEHDISKGSGPYTLRQGTRKISDDSYYWEEENHAMSSFKPSSWRQ